MIKRGRRDVQGSVTQPHGSLPAGFPSGTMRCIAPARKRLRTELSLSVIFKPAHALQSLSLQQSAGPVVRHEALERRLEILCRQPHQSAHNRSIAAH